MVPCGGGQKSFQGTAGACFSTPRTHTLGNFGHRPKPAPNRPKMFGTAPNRVYRTLQGASAHSRRFFCPGTRPWRFRISRREAGPNFGTDPPSEPPKTRNLIFFPEAVVPCGGPEIVPRHRWGMFFDPQEPYLAPRNDFRFWSKIDFFIFPIFFDFENMTKGLGAAPNRVFRTPKVSLPTPSAFLAPEGARGDFVFRDVRFVKNSALIRHRNDKKIEI